jgi:hypothetical protein
MKEWLVVSEQYGELGMLSGLGLDAPCRGRGPDFEIYNAKAEMEILWLPGWK